MNPSKSTYFLIKVEGRTKIPDYVQLRDEAYTLLAYFRLDRPEKALIKAGFEPHLDQIKQTLETLPFGKVYKLEL